MVTVAGPTNYTCCALIMMGISTILFFPLLFAYLLPAIQTNNSYMISNCTVTAPGGQIATCYKCNPKVIFPVNMTNALYPTGYTTLSSLKVGTVDDGMQFLIQNPVGSTRTCYYNSLSTVYAIDNLAIEWSLFVVFGIIPMIVSILYLIFALKRGTKWSGMHDLKIGSSSQTSVPVIINSLS